MKKMGLDSCNSWVVAVSSCIVFLLVSWPMRLGAQLFVSMLTRYDTNRKDASFPFATASLMRSLSGPFAGYFGELIGLGRVTLLGCLFCTIGVGGCFFADDIVAVDISLGIIFGIGFGWSTCLVPEILNRNFKKHRNKAYGVFFGGSGIGAFLSPPVLEVILNTYGVSGTFLIMCGIILHSVPFAMLLSTPKTPKKEVIQQSIETSATKEETSFQPVSKNIKELANEVIVNKQSTCNKTLPVLTTVDNKTNSVVFTQSLKPAILEESQVVVTKYRFFDTSELDNQNQNSKLSNQKNIISTKNSPLSTFQSIDILWNPLFLLISLLQSVNIYINLLFWTITVDLVRDKGVEHYLEVYFVMASSLFDTAGRFFLGSLIDCGLFNVPNFCAASYGVMGLTCFLLPWLTDFYSLMAVLCLFAMVCGGNTASLPGIVTEFINKEKRAVAMSSRIIMYVPISFSMSPLIGYFRGTLGSYDGLLYVVAVVSVLCALQCVLLPWIAFRRMCHQQKNDDL